MRKTDNGAYISLFAQDDFRIHPRVTLNLGVRYDLQFPYTDPENRKLAFVPGAAVAGVADRAGRPAVPRRPGHQPRHRQDRHQQHRPAPGDRLGSEGRRPDVGSRGRRRLLRQHHRQRVEHDRRQSAVHGAPAVPDGEDAGRSVRQPARRRRPVPVHLRSGEPALHAARRRSSVRRSISSGRTPTR